MQLDTHPVEQVELRCHIRGLLELEQGRAVILIPPVAVARYGERLQLLRIEPSSRTATAATTSPSPGTQNIVWREVNFERSDFQRGPRA